MNIMDHWGGGGGATYACGFMIRWLVDEVRLGVGEHFGVKAAKLAKL